MNTMTAEQIDANKFEAALSNWLDKAQAIVDAHVATMSIAALEVLELQRGRKYIRVVKHASNGQRFSFCFIDTTNGNVLKCDGWKKPAKGARGSIYTEQLGVSWTGAHYAR